MIRPLRVSDLPRQFFLSSLRGPDLVQTREGVSKGSAGVSLRELAKRCLSNHRGRCAWALVEGQRLHGVLTARARQGPRAWEVEHLYISPRGWERCQELLECCSSTIAQLGAYRLFLRLPEQSPLLAPARQMGFLSGFSERLYEGTNLTPQGLAGSSLQLRPRTPDDDHLLFRLYNACVPPQVRSANALTLEEWRDAGEFLRGRVQEWVFQRDDFLGASLRLSRHGKTCEAEMMVHPQEVELFSPLYEFARERCGVVSRMVWVVPDYQVMLPNILANGGFQPGERYLVLIKGVTVRIKEVSLVPAGI